MLTPGAKSGIHPNTSPYATIYCTLCKRYIPLTDCTEVRAGELTHESEYGYLHITDTAKA